MSRYESIIENFEPYFVKVLSDIAKERNLSVEKFEKLKKSDALKITVLAPFLADADYAEMFAYANLSVLLTAANFPSVFNPREDISLETRATLVLENINKFAKNKKALELCKKALIAISYKDHVHDFDNDKKEGKYNPLLVGKNKIKYEKMFKSIFNELEKDEKISKIIDMQSLSINKPGFWYN